MSILGKDPAGGLVYLREPSVNLGSSGAVRVKEAEQSVVPQLPPLGFTSRENYEAAMASEPLLWEGSDG